jgi:hypothetical protein
MSPAAQFDDFTGDLILTREALLEAQGLAFAMHYSSGNYEAFVRPRKPEGADRKTAWFVGSGRFLAEQQKCLPCIHSRRCRPPLSSTTSLVI